MGQPVAEMIGNAGGENLRLVFEPAKCARMNDAVTVALKFVAVRMRKLRIPASPAERHGETQGAQAGHLLDISPRMVRAVRLTLLRGLLRSGSSSLRARCGSVFLINSASATVADSLDTKTVG